MRITSIESKRLAEIRYLNAGRGPGDFYNDVVPVHRGFVDALPEGNSAIVVTPTCKDVRLSRRLADNLRGF
ncbi:hypothetical protein [Rhodopirellula sallentina]|uniref:Uncharacterized protein n=1 Tax=Rhodopirellula sallentina SM41 TaxID=1263870 RepID=M5TTI3_9BACT|nr:hypothetical protein [Rhodopirellula sallentina]EMI52470.1 hypothetical protein RSSM_06093 [Rhodopirellula sallentina SM41]